MSNKKISALTSATTPLAGTEEVPIVQSGATVKTTVADITNAGAYPGYFTTLTSTGTTILGDATTDTVTVNGYMGVGGAAVSNIGSKVSSSALTGVSQIGFQSVPVGTSAATTQVQGVGSQPGTAAAVFTCAATYAFRANNAVLGAGSTITNQYGLYVDDQTNGTNNYGIRTIVSSGTNKWNIYASGTAQNYFAGNVGIGTTTTVEVFEAIGTVTGYVFRPKGLADSAAAPGLCVYNEPDTGFFRPAANTIGVSTGGVEAARFNSSGSFIITGAGGLGYGTGSGGTVTQTTSRTTGVTLNKTNGAITLFTAAGSITATTFTVTNSTVAATDVIHVCQKSGTNLYNTLVTAVAAGSFNITFYTTGGIASDAPVFNFAVIKAVTA